MSIIYKSIILISLGIVVIVFLFARATDNHKTVLKGAIVGTISLSLASFLIGFNFATSSSGGLFDFGGLIYLSLIVSVVGAANGAIIGAIVERGKSKPAS